MVASYYGSESGNRTANGERFNPHGLTAAHRTLPFGTRLRVCYRGCVVVRVNDRGPFVRGRSLDLSHGAARAIGMLGVGVARVSVERV
jgi:rare lipoprotein A